MMWPLLFRPSIARRLIVTLCGAYLMAWGGIYLAARMQVSQDGSGEFDQQMVTLGTAVAHQLSQGRDDATARAVLVGVGAMSKADGARQGAPPQHLEFQVRDARDRLFAQSDGNPPPMTASAGPPGFFPTDVQGERFRVYRTSSRDGTFRIDVTQQETARWQLFHHYVFNGLSLAQLLVGLPLLLLPTWLAISTGLLPLRRLSAELAGRTAVDLSPVGVVLPHRELAPVVQEMNATLARLSSTLQRERAFLADAAHELRTPLAVITAQCDTLKSTRDPKEWDAATRRLDHGMARANRLVNQLLTLARLDAEATSPPVATDLADLARDVLAFHAPEAARRNIELAYSGPDQLAGSTPAHAYESVVDNLVGNAIRYGRTGGSVEVTLRRDDTGVLELRVQDDGPGIAPAERERAFERFHRGPGATASGAGLGLAIGKAAVRQMQGEVQLEEGAGGAGLCVGVRWPS